MQHDSFFTIKIFAPDQQSPSSKNRCGLGSRCHGHRTDGVQGQTWEGNTDSAEPTVREAPACCVFVSVWSGCECVSGGVEEWPPAPLDTPSNPQSHVFPRAWPSSWGSTLPTPQSQGKARSREPRATACRSPGLPAESHLSVKDPHRAQAGVTDPGTFPAVRLPRGSSVTVGELLSLSEPPRAASTASLPG